MKTKYVYGQSGVNGFFGKIFLFEYLYQLFYFFIPMYSFKKSVFVGKTVTLNERIYPEKGNTELRGGYKIKRFFPKSIWISWKSFWRGYMLNAVGLNNEGLAKTLSRGKWQKRKEFFHISIQLEKVTQEEIKEEIISICKLLNAQDWQSSYGAQINESCPNTGHGIKQEDLDLLCFKLDMFRIYLPGKEIWVKFNALVHEDVLIFLKGRCAGFIISNAIPFGEAPQLIDWDELFPEGSPIHKRLGNDQQGKPILGGLSGMPVFPFLIDCLRRISVKDPTLNIIAGGGILKKWQIDELAKFRIVQGIALGCVALLRPWRLKNLIRHGNKIFKIKNQN